MKENKKTDKMLNLALGSYEEKPRLSFETLRANYRREQKIKLRKKISFWSSGIIISTFAITVIFLLSSKSSLNTSSPIAETFPKKEITSVSGTEHPKEQKSGIFTDTFYRSLPTDAQREPYRHLPKDPGHPAFREKQKSDFETLTAEKSFNHAPGAQEETHLPEANLHASSKKVIEKKKKESWSDIKKNISVPSKTVSGANPGQDKAARKEKRKITGTKNTLSTGNADLIMDAGIKNRTSEPLSFNTKKEDSTQIQKTIKTAPNKKENSPGQYNTYVPPGASEGISENKKIVPIKEPAENSSYFRKEEPENAGISDQEHLLAPEEKEETAANKLVDPQTTPASEKEPAKDISSKNLEVYEDSVLSDMKAKDSFAYADDNDPYAPSPSKNKHHFVVSPELVYNTLNFKASPNIVNSPYAQKLSDAQEVAPNKFFNASISLGYKFNDLGFNTGIGFLNWKNKVSTENFALTLTSYQRFIFLNQADSIYHMDTVYIGSDKKVIVVNGDSIGPQDYVNTFRVYTIPLAFNYSFHFFSNKLLLEPQAGIQIGIPVSSYQLVINDAHNFTYAKNKINLKDRFFLYDLSLKLGYRVNKKIFIYLKEGYSFNSKSIYKPGYPVMYSIRNLYSSIGISILIK